MSTRECTICRKGYPLNEDNFYRLKTKRFNGFDYRCRSCSRQRDIKRTPKRYQQRQEYFINYQKERNKKYKYKVDAQLAVKRAVEKGELEKGNCEVCGDDNVRGHHPDYSKHLEVQWLCQKHHQRLHSELRKIETPQPN